MLVLTRRPDETLLIGDDVLVRINKVSGNQVSLGIVAPREVRIRRLELLDGPERARLLQRFLGAGKGEECAPSSE